MNWYLSEQGDPACLVQIRESGNKKWEGRVKGKRMSWSKRTKDGKRDREAKPAFSRQAGKIDPNRTDTMIN